MPKSALVPALEPRSCRRRHLAELAGLVVAVLAPRAAAAAVPTVGTPAGRPRILIDRVVFPPGIARADHYVRHLKSTLRREARRVNWGAGRGSTVSFRFTVDELELRAHGDVLEVRCSAHGELPPRRRARSRLVYGGDPKKPEELVRRVLEIVARGVVTRLADLERARRGG